MTSRCPSCALACAVPPMSSAAVTSDVPTNRLPTMGLDPPLHRPTDCHPDDSLAWRYQTRSGPHESAMYVEVSPQASEVVRPHHSVDQGGRSEPRALLVLGQIVEVEALEDHPQV